MTWIYEDISENLIFFSVGGDGEWRPAKGFAVQKIWLEEDDSGTEEEETQRR